MTLHCVRRRRTRSILQGKVTNFVFVATEVEALYARFFIFLFVGHIFVPFFFAIFNLYACVITTHEFIATRSTAQSCALLILAVSFVYVSCLVQCLKDSWQLFVKAFLRHVKTTSLASSS